MNVYETLCTWLLIAAISMGFAWCVDRWVFGINAPGLFA